MIVTSDQPEREGDEVRQVTLDIQAINLENKGVGVVLRDDSFDDYVWDPVTARGSFRWTWWPCCTDVRAIILPRYVLANPSALSEHVPVGRKTHPRREWCWGHCHSQTTLLNLVSIRRATRNFKESHFKESHSWHSITQTMTLICALAPDFARSSMRG